MTTSESPADLVARFCAAWADGDPAALGAYFADDATYHNIPLEPHHGREAIVAAIAAFSTGVDKIEFRVHHLVADGPVVLTERTDVFHLPKGSIEIGVMGTFEVREGLITAWRDYFDLNQFMSQMPAASA
ncbi:MAG: SgcJ/EcaC family oxidoreductase [Acidimicrobiales bacterium]